MPKKRPANKPTPKKKRAAPQGVESHQRKQERLEARRRAKMEALIAQRKKERRDRAIRTTVFVALAAALVWLVFVRQSAPSEIGGNRILSYSTNNGGEQSHTSPYAYNEEDTGTNPPVSGRHNPQPAECGIHNQKIPDENFVHTLEHGAVAVLYNPKDVDLKDIRGIEEIVGSYETTTLSAPYPNLEDPIVLASWSRKMPLDEFDEDSIREYIDTFRDTEPAPEFNGDDPCENDADEAYEEPEPSPSPSPSPSESPAGEDTKGGGDDEASGGKNGGQAGDGSKNGGQAGDGAKMEKEEEN